MEVVILVNGFIVNGIEFKIDFYKIKTFYVMHLFDGRSWRIIKEFCGIYMIKNIDYSIFYHGSFSMISCYLKNSYMELHQSYNNPYYKLIKFGSMHALRRALAKGYKSQRFYSRLSAITFSSALLRDEAILAKYKDDPELFKWIGYCGFKMKIRGRKRRLVSQSRVIHL